MFLRTPPLRTRLIAAALSLCAAIAAPAGAQSGLDLAVATNQQTYYPGDQLQLTVAATNAGGAGTADFYAGVLLPDGVTVATVGLNGRVRLTL